MAVPTVFARIYPQDFNLRPLRVYKRFNITNQNVNIHYPSGGYTLREAIYSKTIPPIGSIKAKNDPTNSFDGSYKMVIWRSLYSRYYAFPYDPTATFEHWNRNYTYKFLAPSASVINVPYYLRGERIRPLSVQFSSSAGIYLKDDGNGNLYDCTIDSSSFTNRDNVVLYLNFDNEFSRFRHFEGFAEYSTCKYESRVFEPDDKAIVRNVYFERGVSDLGMSIRFDSQSFLLIKDRKEFNFNRFQEFAISFWLKGTVSQSIADSDVNYVLSKSGTVYKQKYTTKQYYKDNGTLITVRGITGSFYDESIDVFPYNIVVYNHLHSDAGKVAVIQAEGSSQRVVSSSSEVLDNNFHHININYTSDGWIELWVDGRLESSASRLDADVNIMNEHSLVFGAYDRTGKYGFSGSIDEFRLYNCSLTGDQIATLANSSSMQMYQTSVVGNVFYTWGDIVISPRFSKYLDALDGDWNITYRSVYTIYEYEVLARIKKGSFNVTQNPSARIAYNSDLLRNDFTGSISPYATTIGLYSDKGECVAVAKLGQPLKMRDDVDINILIRWDL